MDARRLCAAAGAVAINAAAASALLSMAGPADPRADAAEPILARLIEPPPPAVVPAPVATPPTVTTPRPIAAAPTVRAPSSDAVRTPASARRPPAGTAAPAPGPRATASVPQSAAPSSTSTATPSSPPAVEATSTLPAAPSTLAETPRHATAPSPAAALAPPPSSASGPSQAASPGDAAGPPSRAAAAAGSGQAAPAPGRTGPRVDASWVGNAAPVYPGSARRLGEQGEVRLDVHVGVDGQVLAVRLRASSGSNALDRSAIDAVRRWRFTPASVDGQAIDAWYHDWKWTFRLEG